MFKTSLIYFLIRAVNGVLALSTIYILTRILSAEQYGLYALGVAGISLCASVLFQWIAVAVSRFYALHSATPDALLAEAYRLFIRIVIFGSFVTALCAVWPPIPGVTPALALAIGGGAVAMGFHGLGLQVANARGQPVRFGLLTVSRGVIALAGAIAFVQLGFGGAGAVFGFALASVLSAIFFGARRQTTVRHNSAELRKQMIIYGLPLTLTYLATMVLDVSDRFLIGWWLGIPAVAGYAAPYDLTQQTVGAVLNVLFLASYPRIIAAWEVGGAPAARQAMLPLCRAMLLVAPLVAGIFIGLAPEISRFVLGGAIQKDAVQVIPWVAFAIAVGCLKSFYLDISFQLSKVTHFQLYTTGMMALVNVVLNLVLLPRLGVLGAAMSTAVAFSSGAIMSWWFGRRLGVYPVGASEVMRMVLVFTVIVLTLKFTHVSGIGELMGVVLRLLFGLIGFSVAVIATNLSGARLTLMIRLRAVKRNIVR
ncbi:MAG: lipopolysaccharide biosynthesis protein [Polaromonas sp.]|nr:lipopolysaccharide biosynthesis protein [Polaromonas sp.]